MRKTAQLLRSLLSILYYYSRPGHSVSVVGGLVTGGIECRGAVPAETVGVLPGTPGSATQAQPTQSGSPWPCRLNYSTGERH